MATPDPTPAESELINGKTLAKKLGVSPAQVTAWHQDDVIPAAIKEGRCIRFDLEEVRAALRKRAARVNRKPGVRQPQPGGNDR